MHFLVSCAAPSAEIFTAESHGITEESIPQYGDAAPELILVPANAMHQLSAKQNSRMQQSRQSIRLLAVEKI